MGRASRHSSRCLPVSTGTMQVLSRLTANNVDQLTPIASVRQGVQVIYQDFSLFPNLTVEENLSLNSQLERRVCLVDRRQMREIARRAMEGLGVELPLEAIAGELSTAQKQLVAIARALVQEARLIILDEPTTALTHVEVDHLFQIVQSLKQRNVAILFVSHKLREMQDISDHFTILRNGGVTAEGPADTFDSARIVHCMTGRNVPSSTRAQASSSGEAMLLQAESLSGAILRNVSLRLDAGQIVGLTGLLGSGQTELALALFGLEKNVSGQITVADFPRPIRRVQDALEAGVSYVPEDRLTQGLFLDQSIESNLLSACLEPVQSATGLLSPKRISKHSRRLLQEVGVQATDPTAPVRTLSGGNQQRVVLAKWLSRNPRVLILNGPTVGVDIGSKEKLHEKLQQLASGGMAVLMISDDLPELAENCDRVLIMHHGQIVHELSADKLTEEAITNYLDNLE